jgi:hypothetical protein
MGQGGLAMYVRPKQLWWLLPILIGLFFLGMALGAISEQPAAPATPAVTVEERAEADRAMIAELLEQLSGDKERTFSVSVQDYTLRGKFRGENFELNGDVGGHPLQINRNEQEVLITVDGEPQENAPLPFALYTPYEHAMLLKALLQSLSPMVVTDKSKEGWLGFHLALPPEEVTAMLALWLGPSFPIDGMTTALANQISVDYQLYYDAKSKQVRQLTVDLRVKTPTGLKQDQLLFTL